MRYPLRFAPILKSYLWGGRKLAQWGKPVAPDATCAESWEIADHGQDQSIVLAGPLKGQSLSQIAAQFGRELYGRHFPQPRFPLLVKFLDARERLSVQVHPDDTRAARLNPPDLGKTEAWVVLDKEPGSVLYVGLKRGLDRPALQREVARGTCELCLHKIEPAVGDCVLLPAGTVHAIGEGLLLYEIQQSSDTTYRLFDWNRLDAQGKPRPLHVREALDVIDFSLGSGKVQAPQPTDSPWAWQLVSCDKFVLRRWELSEKTAAAVGGDDRFHILSVIAGSVSLDGDPTGQPLRAGDTALVPAAIGPIKVTAHGAATVLEANLP
ncbi:MAG: class I mannose-6-phosphate isomerase [Planctomycetia bacterium]|nr:class I mannose-6-phosphate isomerase [Planctomycetia bacterium]